MRDKILIIIGVISLVINIALINEIKDLPDRISSALNTGVKGVPTDSVKSAVAPKLEQTGKFIYFEGTALSESCKISDSYGFVTQLPQEINDGYFTLCKSSNDGNYFIWSKNKIIIDESNFKLNLIKGWFFSDGRSYQHVEEKYYQSLFPIVGKK